MYRILGIILKNRKTFYNYRTGEVNSIAPYCILLCALSFALTYLFYGQIDVFVSSVITVQSILTGFSFSVLFFLLSGDGFVELSSTSLEEKEKIRKLQKLSSEIFDNVSYYNLTALICIFAALILLLPSGGYRIFSQAVFSSTLLTQVPLRLIEWILWIVYYFISRGINLIFYFSLLESIYTFGRIVVRINYIFEQKLLLRKEASS